MDDTVIDSTAAIEAQLDEAWAIRGSDPDRAERLALEAEERSRAERPVFERGIGRSLLVRAGAAQARHRFAAIIELATEAQQYLGRPDDRRWLAEAISRVGVGHTYSDHHSEAIEHHERALAMWRELGEAVEEAGTLNNLGSTYQRMRDLERALAYYDQSYSTATRVGAKRFDGTLLQNIGAIYMRLGREDEALDYTLRAIAALEEAGNRAQLGQSLMNAGSMYVVRSDDDAAASAYSRALELFRGLSNAPGIASAVSRIGSIDRSRGDAAAALAKHEEAHRIYSGLGFVPGLVEVMLELAEDLIALGRVDEGIVRLEESLSIATGSGLTKISVEGHRRLAAVFEKVGDLARALEHERAAARSERETITAEAHERSREFEATRQAELARKEAEIERLRNVELASALEQLKSAQTQLVHAEKMASLGTLTAGIAHEINNPVNFIAASLAPLERDVRALAGDALDHDERAETLEEIESLLRGIRDGARRTTEIVRSLRTFSRLDEDETKSVDLHEGVDATLTLIRPRLDGITIERIDGQLPPVECRPGAINQVVMNLVANAIDACGGSGTIVIETRRDGDDALVIVRDDGVGIAPEHVERVFEPFFTTKEVGAGQGLGLAISHGIVQAHGGSIEVESAPGAGSTFTIRLPIAAR